MNKRDFIKALGVMTLSTPFLNFHKQNMFTGKILSERKNLNEDDFWKEIRRDYALKKEYVNLENGYYCFIPKPTLNKFINHVKNVNFQGSYYMRNNRDIDNRKVAKRLSKLINCGQQELAITRNTTEADCSLYSSFTAKYPNMVVIIMTPMVVNSVDMEIKRVVTR